MKKQFAVLLSLLILIQILPLSAVAEDALPEENPAEQSEEFTPAESGDDSVEEFFSKDVQAAGEGGYLPQGENGETPESGTEENTGAKDDALSGEEPAEEAEASAEAEMPETENAGETAVGEDRDAQTVPEEESETLNDTIPVSGSCGAHLSWSLTEGVLSITGYGAMTDFEWNASPWVASKAEITEVQLDSRVTSIGSYAFSGCSNLADVTIPTGVITIGNSAFRDCAQLTALTIPAGVAVIGPNAFCACENLETVSLPDSLTTIDMCAFYGCSRLNGVVIPDSVTSLGSFAFYYCTSLTYIRVPYKVATLENYTFGYCRALYRVDISGGVRQINWSVFDSCTSLKNIYFEGSAPNIESTAFNGVTSAAYYPRNNTSWTSDKLKNYGGNISWANPNPDVLQYGETITVNGVTYTADAAGCITPTGDVPRIAAKYTYSGVAGGSHSGYPSGMAVYLLLPELDGRYQVYHASALDNCLQYFGCSIRVTDPQGIRMISGIPSQTKTDLIYGGLYGYTLYEYGTLVQYDSVLGGAELTFDNCGSLHASAYEIINETDSVFAVEDGVVKFTNVLTGFSLNSCKYELAMRPYIKLQHEDGNIDVLYGGTVYRSIGSIAWQNRTAFSENTPEYEYIWNIINAVNGNT